MKKFLSFLVAMMLIVGGVGHVFAVSDPVFRVQKFASCEDIESSLVKIFERYQDRYWYMPMPRGVLFSQEKSISTANMTDAAVPTASPSVGATGPVSETNIQVKGVDEADVVKTDGTYMYSYNQTRSDVRIVRLADLSLIKTIPLPSTFSSVQLYIKENKLILVGQKYQNGGIFASYRYFLPDNKTVIAVYDIANPESPKLDRYNQIDGNYQDSRLIGSTLYFISNNTLRIPPLYVTRENGATFQTTLDAMKKNFSLKHIVPEIREARQGSQVGKYIQSIRSSVAGCQDITFVLPDDETLKHIDFSPSLVSLSSLDITRPAERMKNQILFGDVSQIHMSQSSLYITSVITQTARSEEDDKLCLSDGSCTSPASGYESATLIHRYALKDGGVEYKYTTRTLGNPMSQYSMDEDAQGNFRIVTQSYAWSNNGNKNSTNVSIIDPQGKVIGTLTGIAIGENFQSSRFIGERLYLVTFEQTDPLFVIDLKDPKKPSILGELIMPGYSTYLHPYDADRLIGIGYDTQENQWGGVVNDGLKVDLYNVSDVKNPKKEGSLVLGDQGSSSEVLSNPRAFVWYKEKNLLLLPAQIAYSANDPTDQYRSRSIYQGLYGISIVPGSVTEKFKVSHIIPEADIEKKWKDDCAQYMGSGTQAKSCRKLLDGSEYCGGSTYRYIPNYCYADSTVESYMAANIWNYSGDFVTRALYTGETFYTLAENGVKSWNFSHPTDVLRTLQYSGATTTPYKPIVPMMR